MSQNQGFPSAGYPLIDSNGKITSIWLQFFNSLWQRTGGGANTGNVQSLTVNSIDGIISELTDPNSNPVLNLSLGGITPSSITTSGALIAASGHFNTGLSVAGTTQFGVFNSATITQNGYILINDANGTPRRLLVG